MKPSVGFWFFKKLKKIGKPLSSLIKKIRERTQINKIRNETNITKIQKKNP